MFNRLMREAVYAKTATIPINALYQTYGKICMARELGAITEAEYLTLNHECVADGINNPKYFYRGGASGEN